PASPGANALAAAWSNAETASTEPKASGRPSTEPRNGGLWVDAKTTPAATESAIDGAWLDAKTTPVAPATPSASSPIAKVTPVARPTPPGGTPPRSPAASSVPNALAVDTKTMPIARVAGTPASEIVGRPLATPAAGTPAAEIAAKSAVTPAAGTRTAAGTPARDLAATPTNGASPSDEVAASAPPKTTTAELDEDSLEELEPSNATSPLPVAPSQPIPRQPTPPPMPVVRTRPPTPPPMPVVRTRPPTQPPMPAVKVPAEPIVADVPSPRTSAEDLPRGTFTYPVQRKKAPLGLKLLALACAAGLGFVAVVYLLPMFMGKKEPAPTTTAQVTPPPEPTLAPVETSPAPVETPPVEAPPVETPPVETPPVETAPDKPAQKPTQKPTQRPSHASTKPAGEPELKPMPKPETKPETKPAAKPAVEEPVEDDGCDETSCILSKYEKACCEKYKPKTSDISARTGGGLPENLDKMMVRAGVEKVKPRVVACGEKAATKGTVRIALTVSPAGAVTSAEVAETPDAGLGTCVLAAMKAASFGKSVNGGTFTYPFAF
ncbi:MAG: hypothetical protein HOV81_37800, partial [Kofleriaceae bacterium]|nr:hypothetical protein [Kofleriaceae bacterium]